MSGGAITVGLGVFEKISGQNIPLPVYIGVLLLFVFVACFLAWKEARKQFDILSLILSEKEQNILEQKQTISELKTDKADLKAEKERIVLDKDVTISDLRQALQDEKAKNIPDFVGELSHVGVGEIGNDRNLRTALTCFVSIYNKGAPSVAVGWRLVWLIPGYEELIFVPTHYLESTFLGSYKKQGLKLQAEDAIYNKTSNNPIPRGGRADGYLFFEIPFKRETDFFGTAIKILFNDIERKEYTITHLFLNNKPLNSLPYMPGIKSNPIPPDEE